MARKDVFIMYAKKDMDKVQPLLSMFEENGITFTDSNTVSNAESLIASSKCMVFVSTENSRTLECEALKFYIPYVKKMGINIGKVEYVLDPDTYKVPIAAKIILKGFFTDDPCNDEESLVETLLPYILDGSEAEEEAGIIEEEVSNEEVAEMELEEASEEEIDVEEEPVAEITENEDDEEEIEVLSPVSDEIEEEEEFEEEDEYEEILIEEPAAIEVIEEDDEEEEVIEVVTTQPKKEAPKKVEEPVEELPDADFDVFLCYKERDFFKGAERENDSRDSREIYLFLQREGFKVFYKDETLENIKTQKGKELYTAKAVENAKVMLLFASKPEYVESFFVKRDWVKYYTMMVKGQKIKGSLMPIYRNFAPEKFPHPIKNLNNINKGDQDFKYKLKEYIKGILEQKQEEKVEEVKVEEEVKTVTLKKANDESGLVFELDSKTNTMALVKCESTAKNVVIPYEVDGKVVTKIKEGAFFDNESLESVNIPKGITTIEESAFEGCTHLINLNIDAEHLENFEPYNNVFANAGTKNYGLTVKFGASVDRVPENLFYPENGPKRVPYIVEVIFDKGFSATKIKDYAFAYAKSIQKISIPDSIETIGVNAFVGCSDLKSLDLPDSLVEIENYAFSGCSSLENINLPKNIQSLGAGSFSYCRNLQDLTVPASVVKTGEKVFSDCAKVKVVRCLSASQPSGWDQDWAKGCRAQIIWG